MAPRPKMEHEDDAPVITARILIIIHISLALFIILWGWLAWSLPQ
ncbi:hypothetical protein DmAi_16410 [Acetobacter persici]|uniref:Uncharacterized protein n=1 Tax=Acetobacter persici TaxID=1076596 RepID=A0A6V8I945_9PROT|nr:hypothetical protein DmAi_16410 [Acetobacter persici]